MGTTELVSGEWQRFELTAKTAGYYQVSTTAAVYNGDATINIETDTSIATTRHVASPDNYRTFAGDYVYLNEGVNNVWVQNMGPGFFYLKEVAFTYVEDASTVIPRLFVPGHKFIGASDNALEIPGYTVRNDYYGVHVGNVKDAVATTETLQYSITIPQDDYYDLMMTGTVPLAPRATITLSDGVNEDIVLVDDLLPNFGNQNETATLTLTPCKVYVPAGEYTMTFTFTENNDVGTGDSEMLSHIHGFELTSLNRQDLLFAAMQSAENTSDIKDALEEYADVLEEAIGANVETDFIYPEYAYNALLNCVMLPNGMYESYEDVLTAYDFAKNMISVADDGTGNMVYTVQVGDWNPVGTTVIVAVDTSFSALEYIGEGYLEYDEQTYSYVPVEVVLEGYIPEEGADIVKVFIWDSFDGLKPVF